MATRKTSFTVLNLFASSCPELFGGSADLSPSNLTQWSGSVEITSEAQDANTLPGNYLHYGVREFGMSAIMNGMSLHGGFIPFGGTFLVFIDYAKSALRMAALMKRKVIFVLTHDSIGVGEDGPTHQPVEQLLMIRSTPGVLDWRPCDIVETAVAWHEALHSDAPSALILSRQDLLPQARSLAQVSNITKGGYVLHENTENARPELVIIATGSEVALAVAVAKSLPHVAVRVVSMPSPTRFLAQSLSYQESILPPNIPRVAIEMANTTYWYRFVGTEGLVVGIDSFGESAPAQQLFEHFGFTPEKVLEKLRHHFSL